MKTLNKIIFAVAILGSVGMFSSCTGDLDLEPTDPRSLTAADFSSDPKAYMEGVMADVYLQFATYGVNGNATVQKFDGGMSTFQRAIFILEEMPTDEANWLPADADYGTLQYGIVPSNNLALMGVYSRFMINITLCNDFIQTVNNGYFHLDTDALKAEADEFIRQCKILRAGTYFYLTDLYGNVPYADENTATGSVPAQLSRKEVVENQVRILEDVIAEYNGNNSQDYGYVGLDVAEALLVKYYLNYEVYTGTAAWDKCCQHAENLINRLKGSGFQGSGLAKNYSALFGANNAQYAKGGSNAVNEIIWTIPQAVVEDGLGLHSYANSTFMVNAWITNSPDDATWRVSTADDYNSGNGWKCMTGRLQLAQQFDWLDDNMSKTNDQRTRFWRTSEHGFTYDDVVFDQDHYGRNGYLTLKYSNWGFDEDGNIDPALTPQATDQLGGDYAVIRLAEIYLSYAEAALQGGGDRTKALEYTNLIRQRAGLDAWDAGEFNLVTLRGERCRELYTENCRRTDLIRYGQWISGYTWAWKNNVKGGSDFPSYYNLYPLPSSIVTLAGYTQNPGY